MASFVPKEVLLVPVCRRSELDSERHGAYLADSRLLAGKGLAYELPADRKKHRFKLRLKSPAGEHSSSHTYIVRVPRKPGNGHFVVEIEYEGEGSQ